MLAINEELRLIREENNPYDKNAIAIYYDRYQIGYINKELVKDFASRIDNGVIYKCFVSNITGSTNTNLGVNKN